MPGTGGGVGAGVTRGLVNDGEVGAGVVPGTGGGNCAGDTR